MRALPPMSPIYLDIASNVQRKQAMGWTLNQWSVGLIWADMG